MNRLLAGLPREEWERWQPALEAIEMPAGQVLYESGSALGHAYFPTTAIVSLLYVTQSGASAEMAVVGSEGIVGVALFMGGNTTPNRAVVQSAGQGYRLPADMIRVEFESSMAVMHLLLRYTQALITQMAQTAVCNRHHSACGAKASARRRASCSGPASSTMRAGRSPCSTAARWSVAPASATGWSAASTDACCRLQRRPSEPDGGRRRPTAPNDAWWPGHLTRSTWRDAAA